MSELQLFAITAAGPRRLPLPPGATGFNDLYAGLPLGVYSALRTFAHNKFLYLEEHIARTRRSMALLGWDYVLDEERLRRALHEVCSAYPGADARVRFDVLAAPAVQLGSDSRELIGLTPFTPPPPHYYSEGVGVELAPALARARPLIKTADFAQARQAYPAGQSQAAYEYLLVSADGRILEGTGTNFWAVRDGVVWAAGAGVLEGVTRKIILGLLPELGIPVRLEAVGVDEIGALDEAAISGASRALLPVVRIGGQTVGDGRPGPICARILAAYNAFVTQAVQTAVRS